VLPGLAAGATTATPATPAATEAFEIGGEVANPGRWTVADLQALPAESVDVTYITDAGDEVQHHYTGVRFWDLLQEAQPLLDPDQRVASLLGYVVLTAKDGYVVVLSLGEIDPEFGGQPFLLAWEENGQPLAGERSPVVLVTPGDRTEGRYIHGIVTIDVHTVDTPAGG
jgi:DMSO/TMAO reductase YedYZ molybdopterin-dependent catalytic subunit